MASEKNQFLIKGFINPDLNSKFEELKKKEGIDSDAEMLRHMIASEYERTIKVNA